MIRIIKEGTLKRIKCLHCGCFFSYEEEDIQTELKRTIDGLKEYLSKNIECPQCKKIIILEDIK